MKFAGLHIATKLLVTGCFSLFFVLFSEFVIVVFFVFPFIPSLY